MKLKPEVDMGIGKRDCKACIMNSDGSIAEESVYNNILAEAVFAYSIVKKYGKCIAVRESTAMIKDVSSI